MLIEATPQAAAAKTLAQRKPNAAGYDYATQTANSTVYTLCVDSLKETVQTPSSKSCVYFAYRHIFVREVCIRLVLVYTRQKQCQIF